MIQKNRDLLLSLGLSLLACISNSFICAEASDDSSLVESSLEKTGDQRTEPELKPAIQTLTKNGNETMPAQNNTQKDELRISGHAASGRSRSDSVAVSPQTASTRQPVVSTAPPRPKDSDSMPPPGELSKSPIHSQLETTEKTIMKVPLGVKIGKSFAVDEYRGKSPLQTIQTVIPGTPLWAIPEKKKQIAAVPAPPAIPQAAVRAPAAIPGISSPAGAGSDQSISETTRTPDPEKKAEEPCTLNLRFLIPPGGYRTEYSIWAYPYPPKPPKRPTMQALPETESQLKSMLLNFGYTNRPDLSRPYPDGGKRWLHAFDAARKKSGLGYPHTMITMYPWVNKIFPYVYAECCALNRVEEDRMEKYEQVVADYDRVHADLEAMATARGLSPIEIKVNPRGIAQANLPPGNWWLAATRKTPDLRFYWRVPLSCNKGQSLTIQFNESNALVIAGAW